MKVFFYESSINTKSPTERLNWTELNWHGFIVFDELAMGKQWCITPSNGVIDYVTTLTYNIGPTRQPMTNGLALLAH